MKKALWLLPVLLVLSGCASPIPGRDVSRMQLVSTLGIDGTPGELTVSVSSRSEGEELPGMHASARGESIHLAIRALEQGGIDGEPYFAHVQYVLCGADAAGDGMGPLLDHFQRSPQTRLDIPLYIIKEGNAAEELVTAGEEEQEITELLSALEQESARRGAKDATVLSVARALARQGCALCSAVRAEEKDGALVPCRDGLALVRTEGPAVFLPEDAAFGAELLTGRGAGLLLLLPEGATAELREAAVDAVPRPDGSILRVRASAALTECDGGAPAPETLDAALAEQLAGYADSAMRFMADEGADFADLFSRWHREFRDIFPGREDFLRSMTWDIETDCAVVRSFDIDGVREESHG